jgi:hypothetical protein
VNISWRVWHTLDYDLYLQSGSLPTTGIPTVQPDEMRIPELPIP